MNKKRFYKSLEKEAWQMNRGVRKSNKLEKSFTLIVKKKCKLK